MNSFKFSVIRIVPDPVKDEGINVGVVVVSERGSSGDILYNTKFRTRVSRLKRDFPYRSALAALEDIRTFIGLEGQMQFGAAPVEGNPQERLITATQYFEGQIQLTDPAGYKASDLQTALHETYQRYVAQRLPSASKVTHLTASQMKDRIWRTVSKWKQKNLTVEKGGILRGESARHPADFIIRNGTARAAIFALPAAEDEQAITFLYRDSLPTIAADMDKGFLIIGVLPDVDQDGSSKTVEFISETRSLLAHYSQVETAVLSKLDELEDQFVRRLL